MSILRITSPAFKHEGMIPSKYTCDGRDIIPPLRFEDLPKGAASLALVMDDPDCPSGTFDHWVVWNISAATASVEEGREPQGVQGRTSFGRMGYGGPCPPRGVHRYFFKLYALDSMMNLPVGARKKDLEQAMKGHMIEQAVLMGKYSR